MSWIEMREFMGLGRTRLGRVWVRLVVCFVGLFLLTVGSTASSLESGDLPDCDGDAEITDSLGVISDGASPVYPTSR